MRIPLLAWPAFVLWGVLALVTPGEPYRPAPSPEWAVAIRDRFADAFTRFGGDGAELVPGLVLGDTSAQSEGLTNAMRVASLAHLTAVSGANCAVIVATVFGLCALVGLGIWWRCGVAFVALASFVVVVGPEPSVIRAAIMATIALIALALGRPSEGLAVLSAAVIIALAISPGLARSMGFALSVAATTGLLVLARPLVDLLARWLPMRIAMVVAVPLAAQIAVQPLLLVFAPAIATYGVIANVVTAPLAPVATIAGLGGLVLLDIPVFSIPLMGLSWLAGSGIAWVARIIAAAPAATIPWPIGVYGIALAALCSVCASWAIVTRRGVPAVVASAILIGSLSSTVGGSTVTWLSAPPRWLIAQCDVGQGDAVLVRDSGHVALIDVGRDERRVRDCLDRLGIGKIDLLVLTHFDIDHAGAYAAVVGRVGTVIHGPTDGPADELALRRLRDGGANLVQGMRGVVGTLGERHWRVVWPTDGYVGEPGNPASVVVEFSRCGRTCPSVLDLGDLPGPEQQRLLALGGLRAVDIVKVSHHGSRDQFPDLYQRLRPSLALIGVGADNEYGHPTAEVLSMLSAVGASVLRSDTTGISLVASNPDGTLRVWTERAGGRP